jgi:hypothetical protein
MAKRHGIPIITGRAYHPQTQGSIEKANGIFKTRLSVCQREAGCPLTDWVRFLSEIALCVNTTRPSSLPAYVTPFHVWFGREPHFLRARPLNSDNKPCDADGNELVFPDGMDSGASDSGYPELDAESPDDEPNGPELEKWILTAIEERVRKNNILVAGRMVKKATKKAQIFKRDWVVTVAIPSKLRKSTEPKRLPVRIIGIAKHSHTLMSRFGRIKGGFQAGQLNTVQSNTLGLDIPHAWPESGPKILLTQAVQLFNGRGTIASIQKPGRDIDADQAKADKAVVAALNTVAKWVAKLPPAALEPVPASSPTPRPALASPTPEVEVLPRRRPARQGTKRRQAQVDAEDLLQAQILGEIEATQSETIEPEPVLRRGKRVKTSSRN